MYALTFTDGNYVVTDADSLQSGLTPAATDVAVKDVYNDGPTDRHDKIGDTPNDHFRLSEAGGLNGELTFVSVAHGAESSDAGFIAYNAETEQYYYFTNTAIPNAEEGSSLVPQEGLVEVCFMPGTMIRTPDGERPVESLSVDDQVTAIDGRDVAIRWIGRQTVAPRFADELRLPIRIRAGALAENVPSRDLLLSPDHALLIDGVLIHAGALVNGTTIVRESAVPPVFVYHHIEADGHAVILAENTPAETFVDNIDRRRFDNWQEHDALFPDGKAIAELPYPRVKANRQLPRRVRQQLAQRALIASGTADRAA